MPGPASFVNFADYLGLNQQAGEDMRARTAADYHGPNEQQIQALSDQHYADARGAGDGRVGGAAQYQQSGAAVQKGIATYGEFLKGMSDPAARQALMEKTYGKGAVSALDSALAGNGQSMSGAKAQISQLQNRVGIQGVAADQRRQSYADETSAYDEQSKRGLQRRQAIQAAFEKQRAQSETDAKNRRVDAYARYNAQHGGLIGAGHYDPSGTVGGSDLPSQGAGFTGAQNQRDWAGQTMRTDEQKRGQTFGVDANGEGYWK